MAKNYNWRSLIDLNSTPSKVAGDVSTINSNDWTKDRLKGDISVFAPGHLSFYPPRVQANLGGANINIEDPTNPLVTPVAKDDYITALVGGTFDIIASAMHPSDRKKQCETNEFLVNHFRPFGLMDALYRAMAELATKKGYTIESPGPGLLHENNRSNLELRVINSQLIITETVQIYKYKKMGGRLTESEDAAAPLTTATCRWVVSYENNEARPKACLSDLTFVHNSAEAEKLFDQRGIFEIIRQWFKRKFTKTVPGLKSEPKAKSSYVYNNHGNSARLFSRPHTKQPTAQNSEMSPAIPQPCDDTVVHRGGFSFPTS